MKRVLLLYAGIAVYLHLNAQPKEPVNIGDIVPDVPFKNIVNTPADAGSLAALKGKLVILDFWSIWCASCLASMPKMAALQKEFNGKLQVILINPWEDSAVAVRRLAHLSNSTISAALAGLPVIYGDTSWRVLFPHTSVPHHVWIDTAGKVIAITNGDNATADHVNEVLNGKLPMLTVKKDLAAEGYDPWQRGLFTAGHPALQTMFFSGIQPYNPGFGSGKGAFVDTKTGLYTSVWLNADIMTLYAAAYSYSKEKQVRLLIELKDKITVTFPSGKNLTDQWKAANLYSYQISLLEKDKGLLNEYMQQDLNRFFKQHRGVIAQRETRELPALALTVKNKNLLATKGGKSKYQKVGDSTYTFSNTPFNTIANTLQDALEDMNKPVVVIDETGFTGNVDMILYGNLGDAGNVQKQLARYGLELKKTTRKVEVVCIQDK
ncbi:MAG: DUF3738 domain-containing protein [Niabella sp.]